MDSVQEVHFDNMLRNGVLETIKHLAPIAQCHILLVQHYMFDVIRTHPSAEGHGSERRLEAVHVKQERAIVTLDERSHAATPVTREADFDR